MLRFFAPLLARLRGYRYRQLDSEARERLKAPARSWVSAKAKFGAMMAPRCIPCLPAEVSTSVRRAGVAAWVSEMSKCRKTIVLQNDALPEQAKLIGMKMSGVRHVLTT